MPHVSHSVHLLHVHMDRVANTLLQQRHGLSYARFYFLLMVQGQQPTAQHAIAVALGCSDAAVSKLVSTAARDGLLRASTDATHQRRNLVLLTPAGELLVQRCLTTLETCFDTIVDTAGIDSRTYQVATDKLIQALTQKEILP